MTASHRFARVVFTAAGIYGLVTVAPLYLMERSIAASSPPAITHPEYFYGFVGTVVAWQLLFLVVARAPDRLRAVMPTAVAEKLAFGVPAIVLYVQHRIPGAILGFGLMDLAWCALFLVSYLRLRP